MSKSACIGSSIALALQTFLMLTDLSLSLILLLIASDLVKSLWFVIYSSTTLNRSLSTDPGSTFCQISGFFLALGIEASDAAVFLIALHWTVFIFRSNRAVDKSGIYPYRYLAFGIYVLFPSMMSSMAFLTRFPAYVDTGQYCYLPAKPWWVRMSLSWIPRYINMTLIIAMYCASYVYIRITMRRFRRQHASVPTSHRERQTPETPPLTSHGLIPSPLESRRISFRVPTIRSLKESSLSIQAEDGIGFRESLRLRLDRLSVSSIKSRGWQWQGLDWEADVGAHPYNSGLVSPRTGAAEPAPAIAETGYRLQPPRPSLSTLKFGGTVESPPSWHPPSQYRLSLEFYRRPISTTMEEEERSGSKNLNVDRSRHTNGSQMHIYTILQRGPSHENEGDPNPSTPIASLDYETLESDGISRGRDRIRRQLRLLFIYPAVYACVWVFPLVSDIIEFGKDRDQRPYWVLVASIVSLCVQGLADTIVFCLREKPWRHVKGGFWENLGIFMNGLSFESRNEIGKTREEMFHDGSRARLRREEEMEREQRASRMSPGRTSQVSVSRNWWDVEPHGDDELESQDSKCKDEEWRVGVMSGDRGTCRLVEGLVPPGSVLFA